MPDFGDDAGQEINREMMSWIREFFRRSHGMADGHDESDGSRARQLGEMIEKSRSWFEGMFQRDATTKGVQVDSEEVASQALALTGRTPTARPMPSDEIAKQFASFARDGGVWAYGFEDAAGRPWIGFYEEDTQRLTEAFDRFAELNPESAQIFEEFAKEYCREQQTVDAEVVEVEDVSRDLPGRELPELPPAEKEYMREVRDKVAAAREGAQTEAEFIDRCKAEGLSVGTATDGELLFTHPNGWFDVRGDTLGKEYTHEAFERGTGEKSEELSRDDVTEQAKEAGENYIQSHDGGDIDTRTRVVESVTKTDKDTPAREGKGDKDYTLDSEARDMTSAKNQLSGEKANLDRDREVPSWQDRGTR